LARLLRKWHALGGSLNITAVSLGTTAETVVAITQRVKELSSVTAPGVQTQHIATLADITSDDCRMLDAAMTKCSKWLPGYDRAPAGRAAVPDPAELKNDIKALENWVAAIRKRRK
jgi:hypothetical protein